MKTLILLLLVVPFISNAQIGAGLTGGISSKQSAVAEMMIGAKASPHINLYPMTIKVHAKMSDPTMPVIFESRAAYRINRLELYAGYGYHFAGQDNKASLRQYTGFKPGAGIIFHLSRMLIVTTAVSGNVYTLQFGFFKFK